MTTKYASVADIVYWELRTVAESIGAFIDDEADDVLLSLATQLANHPDSDISEPIDPRHV